MSVFPWVNRRRRKLRETPLDPSQWAILEQNVALVRSLSADERRKLEGDVQVFLDEKTFEGCGGLAITDEIRLTIAAQACLLILGHDVSAPYPDLDVLRIYPTSYHAPVEQWLPGGVVSESVDHRLGESSHRGFVVLSWDDVRRGARRFDGHNVVLHEFAHQLDTRDGHADGAPVLPDAGMYGPWADVLGRAYAELIDDVDRHRSTTLDPYGATNPAEFFAVATEAFFERPRALKESDPELYAILGRYYRQDPAGRVT